MTKISTYQENSVATQSKGRLIVLLYEGAVRFLKQAQAELDAQNWAQKGVYINKAQAIVDELDACLDMEAGGEVAANLHRIYGFAHRHLGAANVERDDKKIQDVIDLLEELNEGWKAVMG
jgi:flagellar protein FliS